MINNPTISLLSRSLDGAALRQDLLAHNIANADTPGFRRQDLDFATMLHDVQSGLGMSRTHARHLPTSGSGSPYRVIESTDGVVRADGNTVVIETEMARLSQNAMFYQAVSTQLSKEFARLRAAISGRG